MCLYVTLLEPNSILTIRSFNTPIVPKNLVKKGVLCLPFLERNVSQKYVWEHVNHKKGEDKFVLLSYSVTMTRISWLNTLVVLLIILKCRKRFLKKFTNGGDKWINWVHHQCNISASQHAIASLMNRQCIIINASSVVS